MTVVGRALSRRGPAGTPAETPPRPAPQSAQEAPRAARPRKGKRAVARASHAPSPRPLGRRVRRPRTARVPGVARVAGRAQARRRCACAEGGKSPIGRDGDGEPGVAARARWEPAAPAVMFRCRLSARVAQVLGRRSRFVAGPGEGGFAGRGESEKSGGAGAAEAPRPPSLGGAHRGGEDSLARELHPRL